MGTKTNMLFFDKVVFSQSYCTQYDQLLA